MCCFFQFLETILPFLDGYELRDTNEKNMQEIGEDVKDEKVKEIK